MNTPTLNLFQLFSSHRLCLGAAFQFLKKREKRVLSFLQGEYNITLSLLLFRGAGRNFQSNYTMVIRADSDEMPRSV